MNAASNHDGGDGQPRLPRWQRALNAPFVGLIWLYRLTLSPLMGGHCRFQPTCSRYSLEAYQVHGPIRGSWLTARRLLRCHPLGGKGYDPVPRPAPAPRSGLRPPTHPPQVSPNA